MASAPLPQAETPKSAGWGLGSIMSWLSPAVIPPSPRPAPAVTASDDQDNNSNNNNNNNNNSTIAPATATATSTRQANGPVLSPTQLDEITAGLTPTPVTPTPANRAQRQKKTQKKGTKTRMGRAERTIKSVVKHAVRDVDPSVRDEAAAWAKRTAEKLSQNKDALEAAKQPMKLKDITVIPARRPWEASASFGLLPEFDYDSSDDEEAEAPLWYTLDYVDQNGPPKKKRKTSANPAADEEHFMKAHPAKVSSNGKSAKGKSAYTSPTQPTIIDSHGTSTSLNDIHPRPATQPSPMFDNPVIHHEGGNVFSENKGVPDFFNPPPGYVYEWNKTPADREREIREQELQRNGHTANSGSFSVPEGSTSSEEDEGTTQLPWTQQPPPAPIPAHASLPTPVRDPVRDPVEIQRAMALKHTPAKQSGLRQVMLPSPSVLSDAGGSIADSIASPFPGMPDVEQPLDLPDYIIEAARQLIDTEEWKEKTKHWWGTDEIFYGGHVGDEDESDAEL
ncbi:hypothetical protein K491DRAFT_693838 [Lophiostoma macrostomum CBS 122681]|uniref:Uncharacterized protein n=1 Tax=Lophiostoma macrostomum CBS 122681 TaxID=1314788 RepID=A0A6A6T547_9PLEO|nr:hypothetical protein K491DRAFT_693838 [Lophiostoma macrostomum CBS 122681]